MIFEIFKEALPNHYLSYYCLQTRYCTTPPVTLYSYCHNHHKDKRDFSIFSREFGLFVCYFLMGKTSFSCSYLRRVVDGNNRYAVYLLYVATCAFLSLKLVLMCYSFMCGVVVWVALWLLLSEALWLSLWLTVWFCVSVSRCVFVCVCGCVCVWFWCRMKSVNSFAYHTYQTG